MGVGNVRMVCGIFWSKNLKLKWMLLNINTFIYFSKLSLKQNCRWLFHTGRSISRRRQWQATPVLLPRKSHGRRSLVGCMQSMGSLRARRDWATSLSLFTFTQWRRKWQPTPVFLPGESQGWGSLVGCRLWGCRVGHDWSHLAAAAAAAAAAADLSQNVTFRLPATIWPEKHFEISVFWAQLWLYELQSLETKTGLQMIFYTHWA